MDLPDDAARIDQTFLKFKDSAKIDIGKMICMGLRVD